MTFDYSCGAELFPPKTAHARTKIGYRRFSSAAEAIQFAIEMLPSALLRGTFLEVGDDRFGHEGIRQLYDDPRYPLIRRK